MKYLMFIKHKELDHAQTPPPALMAAMEGFVGRMFDSGMLKETGGLKPVRESVRIRSAKGTGRTPRARKWWAATPSSRCRPTSRRWRLPPSSWNSIGSTGRSSSARAKCA